jgi:hypothetical protein
VKLLVFAEAQGPISSISKIMNRKASSYALLITSAVRDGGLRVFSIKVFSHSLRSQQGSWAQHRELDGINIFKRTG